MNRLDYLNRLRQGLAKLPSDEVEEILADYEEHFSVGLGKALSEAEVAGDWVLPKRWQKLTWRLPQLKKFEKTPVTP